MRSIKSKEYYCVGPLGVWRNHTADGALRVLGGEDFVQLRMPQYFERLAKEYARDFPHIRFIAKYMPLFHDGPAHRGLRKQAAELLREISDDLQSFEDEVTELVTQRFRQPGRLEVIDELIEPIIRKTALMTSGLDFIEGTTAILSGNNSLRAFRDIDASLGRLHEMAKARFPKDSADRRGIRMAVATMGAEPLGATVANSFLRLFRGAKSRRISTLDWGPYFPATGLVAVGRECLADPVDLGGGAGNARLFEVDLTRCLHEKNANPNHIFGVGRHACLGRGLSLALWQRIVAKMRQNNRRVEFISSTPAKRKIFGYPSELTIEVKNE